MCILANMRMWKFHPDSTCIGYWHWLHDSWMFWPETSGTGHSWQVRNLEFGHMGSTVQECAASIILDAWHKISGCVLKATCWNWSNEFSIAGFPQFWFSLGLLQSDVLGTWRSAYWLIFKKHLKINYILDNLCWIGVSSRPTIPTSVNRA